MADQVVVAQAGNEAKTVSGVDTVGEAMSQAGYDTAGKLMTIRGAAVSSGDTVRDYDTIVVGRDVKGA